MKLDAQTIYPDCMVDGKFDSYNIHDYQPIIDAIGAVAIQWRESAYEGDTSVVFLDGGRVGYLIFGWGSCSGCDALQAAKSLQELQAVIDGLVASVQWFDNRADFRLWVDEKDWEGQYCYRADGFIAHLEEIKAFAGRDDAP
jgi:hypothetical protein